ncbi:MAG TPA: aldehyde dehydrogenase [Bacteroidota bacterium]|nr:aldehyde dehydrogenase [Bacteroidota bacterium]
MEKVKNYINGKFVAPVSNQYIENFEPATGEVYSHVPDSDERDVTIAVDVAAKAFPSWSATSVEERSRALLRIAELIEKNLDNLALAESRDTGKPLALAKSVDMQRASVNFRFFAAAIINFHSEAHPMGPTGINYTLRNPIGVAGCISPWNLPLYLFTWKIAPAMAIGNCVVGKPSELAPMTAYMLAELCTEAGLPPGVLNIVNGYGHKVGAAITAHQQIPVISFTGGTKTGAEISKTAAPLFKKLSLEMGGKNPTIIFTDCNYDQMLETTVRSSFSNQGEICFCGSRIFIEKSLYSTFRDDFVAATKKLRVGDPLHDGTDLGALISKQHLDKILSYIELAKQEGGKILYGGKRVCVDGRCKNGWFVEPTIIENLPYDCRTNQEEIFGPVVTLIPFDTEEEVLTYANSTQYGLASIIWTQNLTRAHRVAAAIQAGIVWINCWMLRDLRTPFGGMKNSGLGREGGLEALRFFTEPKNVCVRL